jgi:GGDEF domain-containing protein
VKDLKIGDSHLDQIEHLLAQSMNGIHLLFDNETIAQVLKVPTEHIDLFQLKNLDKIQELFSEFIQRETLQDKQLFLQSLDKDSFELLLRTYFHIVDNSLFTTEGNRH